MDGRPEKHETLEGIQLDVVDSLCYLGDQMCLGDGCELATIAQTRAAWESFVNCLLLLHPPKSL